MHSYTIKTNNGSIVVVQPRLCLVIVLSDPGIGPSSTFVVYATLLQNYVYCSSTRKRLTVIFNSTNLLLLPYLFKATVKKIKLKLIFLQHDFK